MRLQGRTRLKKGDIATNASKIAAIARITAIPTTKDLLGGRCGNSHERSDSLNKISESEEIKMSGLKILAIVLICAGLYGLVNGNFSYTKETHEAKLGSLELSVKDKENTSVPTWVGVGAVLAGAAMLLTAKRA
jgi:hypothetical protein